MIGLLVGLINRELGLTNSYWMGKEQIPMMTMRVLSLLAEDVDTFPWREGTPQEEETAPAASGTSKRKRKSQRSTGEETPASSTSAGPARPSQNEGRSSGRVQNKRRKTSSQMGAPPSSTPSGVRKGGSKRKLTL